MVNSISILCLRNIQLNLDWDGIEPYGAYPHKSCKRVQEKSVNFCGSYRNFGPARSTRMDIRYNTCQCMLMSRAGATGQAGQAMA